MPKNVQLHHFPCSLLNNYLEIFPAPQKRNCSNTGEEHRRALRQSKWHHSNQKCNKVAPVKHWFSLPRKDSISPFRGIITILREKRSGNLIDSAI